MNPLDRGRRRLGLLFIGGSLVMLLLGFTVLEPKLKGLGFLVYWLACGGLAMLALLVALLDLVIVNARGRAERRALAEQAAAEIRASMQRGETKPDPYKKSS